MREVAAGQVLNAVRAELRARGAPILARDCPRRLYIGTDGGPGLAATVAELPHAGLVVSRYAFEGGALAHMQITELRSPDQSERVRQAVSLVMAHLALASTGGLK